MFCKLIKNDNTLTFNGEIVYSNVMDLLKEAKSIITSSNVDTLDLSNLEHVDSSAIALFLELIKIKQGRQLKFINKGLQLTKLIDVSGLNKIFN